MITTRLIDGMIDILTALKREVVQQLRDLGAIKIVVGMAGFAAVRDDKGVGFDGNALAVPLVRMGDERADQPPLWLETALDFPHGLLDLR